MPKAKGEVAAVADGLPPRAIEPYGEAIGSVRSIVDGANDAGIRPSTVADAAHHALFARRPKAEYLVGREAKVMAALSRLVPYRTFDKMVLRVMRNS